MSDFLVNPGYRSYEELKESIENYHYKCQYFGSAVASDLRRPETSNAALQRFREDVRDVEDRL